MSDTSVFAAVVIFSATYLMISARRLGWLGLDRPTVALLGAVACVAVGVISPMDALKSVDANTLLLLFGMMGMGAFLAAEGFFERAADALAAKAKTPARLLGWIVWGAGGLSALITNDAVCVLGAPLVCDLVRKHKLPAMPFLLALATAANTGSVATLVGNPQNMLCASLGGLAYREHLLLVGPIAVIALAMNHGLLQWMFRRELRTASLQTQADAPRSVLNRNTLWILGVIGATVLAYTAGADLPWTAAGGLAALFLVQRHHGTQAIWTRIDWSVLVFFAGLFVVVEALVETGLPKALFLLAPFTTAGEFPSWLSLSGLFLVGSNVVSNVPFILVVREAMAALPDPKLGWELLTVASTFAGNLTILGSVANIIVAEKSREFGGLGFFSHLRVGAPLALSSTLVGAMWLYGVSVFF